jgi:hypothetical protein
VAPSFSVLGSVTVLAGIRFRFSSVSLLKSCGRAEVVVVRL